MSTWALFITKPSDLGYDDAGYDLPPLEVRTHVIYHDYNQVEEADGQRMMSQDTAAGQKAARKAGNIDAGNGKATEIVSSDPDAHFILWHDLEAERHALKKAIPGVVDIYGSMDYDKREQRVLQFANGECRLFA